MAVTFKKSIAQREASAKLLGDIASVAEYMQLINAESDSDAATPSLFRGQTEDWPLLPKLARLYKQQQLKGPYLDIERKMLDEFSRQAAIYVANNQTPWDWLALAQHHGMATRLLDWTENPLLALWFAVKNAPKDADQGKHGVVWIFSPPDQRYIDSSSEESPFSSTSTKILLPRHSNMRLRVQSGRFTVHHYRQEDGEFIPLEKHKTYKKYLKKITIKSEAFSQIRSDLDRCGLNAGTMFPDLGGLAEHIEWRHTLLDDEKDTPGT